MESGSHQSGIPFRASRGIHESVIVGKQVAESRTDSLVCPGVVFRKTPPIDLNLCGADCILPGRLVAFDSPPGPFLSAAATAVDINRSLGGNSDSISTLENCDEGRLVFGDSRQLSLFLVCGR